MTLMFTSSFKLAAHAQARASSSAAAVRAQPASLGLRARQLSCSCPAASEGSPSAPPPSIDAMHACMHLTRRLVYVLAWSGVVVFASTGGDRVPAPAVVSEAYCTEARAAFLGAFLHEEGDGPRIGLDLGLTAVADCGAGSTSSRFEVTAGTGEARAGDPPAPEICVLWVETSSGAGGAHSTKCYAMDEMPRVDVAVLPRQRFRLLAWPRYPEWPDAVAGSTVGAGSTVDVKERAA